MNLIVDPGSCHDGDLNKAKELVKIAYECGASACKFQLIGDKEIERGNVLLPWEWMTELTETADIEVFASVFSGSGADWLVGLGCQSIKFAHCEQMLYQEQCNHLPFENIYLSSGVLNCQPKECINLFCIPEYPVLYDVNFDNIFPRFDGFSSHCMGIEQDKKAIDMGAKYIEKHIKGTWDSPCLDAKFAINPQQLEELVKYG